MAHASPDSVWEIVVKDWHKDTPSPFSGTNVAYAYRNARKWGRELARELALSTPDKLYEYVHLVAHSAGANLINETALCLQMMKGKKQYADVLETITDPKRKRALEEACQPQPNSGEIAFVHLTFLDAYAPLLSDSANQYGRYADFAEHYVDKGGPWTTDDDLKRAFNFDITEWFMKDESYQLEHFITLF